MKKLILISTLFLVFLSIGQMRSFIFDDELFFHVNINNPNRFDLRDVNVKVIVLHPDIESKSATFDKIDDKSSGSRVFIIDLPDDKEDEYIVRVSVTDRKGRRAIRHHRVLV